MKRKRKRNQEDPLAPEPQGADFYYEHAGRHYRVGASQAEKDRSHRERSKKLQQATEWARQQGYTFVWELEEKPWDRFYGDVDPGDVADVVQVRMHAPDGSVVDSVGGILEGHDFVKNLEQRHVLEAELSLDSMEEMLEDAQAGIPEALETIQAHRRRIGQRPLDPKGAGWEPEDILAEAERIRTLNPAQIAAEARRNGATDLQRLKRRLMR